MKPLKAQSIDHINVAVNDLNESVEFYARFFGFEEAN